MLNPFPVNPTAVEKVWICVTSFAVGVTLQQVVRALWLARSCRKKRIVAEYLALRQFGLGRENLHRRTALARRLLSNMSAAPRQQNRAILS